MSESINDLGITIMQFDRISIEIIPKLQEMNGRLAGGEQLDHWDIQALDEELEKTKQFGFFVEQHPEHQVLYTELVNLCKEITSHALMNEESFQNRSSNMRSLSGIQETK